MLCQYDRGVSCILDDESGMGKKLQVISFLSHLIHHRGITLLHLVIVESDKLFHWEYEFGRMCPELKIFRLNVRGESSVNQTEQGFYGHPDFKSVNVVLTTFQVFKNNESLRNIFWKSIIIDDTKLFKVSNDVKISTLKEVKGHFRLLLTPNFLSRPLNRLQWYSMLNFLHPSIFTNPDTFQEKDDLRYDLCHTVVFF